MEQEMNRMAHPGGSHLARLLSRRKFLKSTSAVATAAAVAGIGFPAIAQSKPDQLIIPDAGGALRDAYIKAHYSTFTEETGIKIVPAEYMGVAQLKAMVDNKAWGGGDVIALSAGEAAIASKQGLVEKVDYGLIDRPKMLPKAAHDYYCLSLVAASLIAWNTKKCDKSTAPQGWVDFFTPGKFKGPRGLWKNATLTMDIAAMGAGVPKDKLYPLDIDKSISALKGVRDDLVFWEHGAESAQFLIDNQVDFEFAWNGRVYGPKTNGQPVDYSFNQALLDGDAMVIPKGSPNQYWAQRFLAHMMKAKTQAALSQIIPYGPTNTDANALIPASVQANLPTGPDNFPKTVFQDFEWWANNGQKAYDAFNEFLLG
jgi:putative spermidine/putrescine transport system substrate-binding protein